MGPGINPNDKYVVEPSTTRADYQLEPGVVSLEPDTDKIKNAINKPLPLTTNEGLLKTFDSFNKMISH